eukprot:6647754-Prymnesium_polylepis.2
MRKQVPSYGAPTYGWCARRRPARRHRAPHTHLINHTKSAHGARPVRHLCPFRPARRRSCHMYISTCFRHAGFSSCALLARSLAPPLALRIICSKRRYRSFATSSRPPGERSPGAGSRAAGASGAELAYAPLSALEAVLP